MIELQRILVPTDFSENSQPALQLGTEIAQRFGAELFLLYVVEPSGGLETLPDLPDDVQLDLISRSPYARAEMRLQAMPTAAQSKGLTVHRHVEIGKPATVVLEYATTHDVDLIVIGTHGHTGWTHVLLGSVAESVVQYSKCPVLTVRSQAVRRDLQNSRYESTAISEPPASAPDQQTGNE